jgi:hypothetical protein
MVMGRLRIEVTARGHAVFTWAVVAIGFRTTADSRRRTIRRESGLPKHQRSILLDRQVRDGRKIRYRHIF